MPKAKTAADPAANGNGHKPTINLISVKEISPSNRNQERLEENCRNAARLKLLPLLLESKEASDLFGSNAMRLLLVAYLIETANYRTLDDFEKGELVSNELYALVEESSYPKSVEGLTKLAEADFNRLASAILFSHVTRSDSAGAIVQKLAADVPGFNLDLEIAEALVAQIPEAKRPIAEAFLKKVQEAKGNTPKFPAVHWPEEKAKKAVKLAKEKEGAAA